MLIGVFRYGLFPGFRWSFQLPTTIDAVTRLSYILLQSSPPPTRGPHTNRKRCLMLIAELMALMDRASVPSVSRNVCLRAIFRSILGIQTYAKQRQALKKIIGSDPESVVWEYLRDTSNRGTHTSIYWRAFGRFISNRDAQRLDFLGVAVEDLWYTLDILDREDIEKFINIAEERGYNSVPASATTVSAVLHDVRAQVRTCASCLRFVSTSDPGFSHEDWCGHFRTVAVRTIYQYDWRAFAHVVNTVRSALWKELANLQKRYGFAKYSTMSKAADGTFVHNRVSLEVKTADGGFIDVPGLHGRFSSQTVESDLDVDTFLADVERQSVRLASYLRDVTYPAHCSQEFSDWLASEYPNKNLDTRELNTAARRFYKITSKDLDRASHTLSTLQLA